MQSDRKVILAEMAAATIWSAAVLWIGFNWIQIPVFALVPTVLTAFLAPGIFVMAIVGRVAIRRFLDDDGIDGTPYTLGSSGELDQRILQNTLEQLVLALCVWPAAAVLLLDKGPGVIVALSVSFTIARVLYWVGYHRAPRLRSFGFAAGTFPTIFVVLWIILRTVWGG